MHKSIKDGAQWFVSESPHLRDSSYADDKITCSQTCAHLIKSSERKKKNPNINVEKCVLVKFTNIKRAMTATGDECILHHVLSQSQSSDKGII